MQDVLTSAIGLDVHRDIIAACHLHGNINSEQEAEHRTFSMLAPCMRKMREWIESRPNAAIWLWKAPVFTGILYMTRLNRALAEQSIFWW